MNFANEGEFGTYLGDFHIFKKDSQVTYRIL